MLLFQPPEIDIPYACTGSDLIAEKNHLSLHAVLRFVCQNTPVNISLTLPLFFTKKLFLARNGE